MKTSELTGQALDWAVAKCEGRNPSLEYTTCTRRIYIVADVMCALTGDLEGDEDYSPSTNWAQGGPIIGRERISIDARESDWQARIWLPDRVDFIEVGKRGAHCNDALIAAMRCYVASKLGDEVKIPKELEK